MFNTTTLEAELDKVASRVELPNRKHYLVTGDSRIGNGMPTKFKRVSSMTSIVDKPALRYWYMNTALQHIKDNWEHVRKIKDEEPLDEALSSAKASPNKARDSAGDYGTRAHALVQELADGTRTEAIPPELRRVAVAWSDWINNADLEIVKTEQPFYWHRDGLSFAGTADLIARRGSKIYIVDYKTGGDDEKWEPYNDHALQLGAYSLCLEYCTGIPVEEQGAIVVKLPKYAPQNDYTIKWGEVNELDYAREAFLSAAFLKTWDGSETQWK